MRGQWRSVAKMKISGENEDQWQKWGKGGEGMKISGKSREEVRRNEDEWRLT